MLPDAATTDGAPDDLVAGVDGCPAGWVVCRWPGDGPLTGVVVPVGALAQALRGVGGACIDMPIGLPPAGQRRAADRLLRRHLPTGMASSVFDAPCRPCLDAVSHADAVAWCRAAGVPAPSLQAWHLVPRIREVDDALATHPDLPWQESHPEWLFALLAGGTALPRKKTAEGRAQRRRLLVCEGGDALAAWLDTMRGAWPARAVATDDLHDAAVLALAARAGAARGWLRLPDPAPLDDHRRPMRYSAPAAWTGTTSSGSR
jgi:predicted RNase H-like nuclease